MVKTFLQRYVIKMIPFSSGDYVHINDVKKVIESLENKNDELTRQLNKEEKHD